VRVNTLNPLNRKWRLADGLVSRWIALPHNSGGSKLYDIVRANHGTLTNGPTWVTSTHQGGFSGLSFDGSNDYVLLTNNLGLSSAMTVAMWVKINSQASTQSLISDGPSGEIQIDIGRTSGRISLLWSNAVPVTSSGSTTLSNGVWYHIAVTRFYNGANWSVSIYINGQLDTSTTTSSNPSASSTNYVLGCRGDALGISSFGGVLDDVGAWNRALTATEVTALYQDTFSGYRQSLNWVKSPTVNRLASASGPFPRFMPDAIGGNIRQGMRGI